ncbi:uncharacterized protein MONOS_6871 [Monocercomonoides exilis]|uniref:uncharacterized protein n=1 Tax=Monocercomonoides exilis TaxID=2049356 RepID=UPI003559864B|nr:hypothetical protein MONOS_6871 [Monocercomonoides exilis]|eukprot:MONOS_6871.1-p1 / transcript=MONOS_6871.1 / gene=MONOS_6871 / organism=Monocercomonoides_exilis_PA203 / gene_product=unspecified product / transcript_product=unspecified product / location=Mono_scaffold00225:30221-30613(+) / protein_length=131 / sequence_SO=supercontig / SO=protein_coding / is_pseudo=false
MLNKVPVVLDAKYARHSPTAHTPSKFYLSSNLSHQMAHQLISTSNTQPSHSSEIIKFSLPKLKESTEQDPEVTHPSKIEELGDQESEGSKTIEIDDILFTMRPLFDTQAYTEEQERSPIIITPKIERCRR